MILNAFCSCWIWPIFRDIFSAENDKNITILILFIIYGNYFVLTSLDVVFLYHSSLCFFASGLQSEYWLLLTECGIQYT